MSQNSVVLHRVLKAAPEKVFRAFADPVAFACWIPPYGFLCTIDFMEFEVGGSFKMSFINFTTGNKHSFGGKFHEIKPNEFLKYSDRFDDPDLPGELITTITLTKVSCGAELHVLQEGIPTVMPLEMCYLGWQESLDKLTKLIEPEIKDN